MNEKRTLPEWCEKLREMTATNPKVLLLFNERQCRERVGQLRAVFLHVLGQMSRIDAAINRNLSTQQQLRFHVQHDYFSGDATDNLGLVMNSLSEELDQFGFDLQRLNATHQNLFIHVMNTRTNIENFLRFLQDPEVTAFSDVRDICDTKTGLVECDEEDSEEF